jgi:enamine deaminase RidA (YjgF/YER057c/UK114 family)
VSKDVVTTTGAPAAIGPYFPADPPARETVQVARLPKDALVEVSATCRVDG